jgi:Xaa-Pro dipeptidase
MTTAVQRAQQEMAAQGIDGLFLFKPHSVFYFAGYASVCSGLVLFDDREPVFCTLWLDAPGAKKACLLPRVASYVFPRDSLAGRMAKIFSRVRPHPRRIGVEKDFIVLRDYERLRESFPSAEFVHVTPMVDRLRAVKTEKEIACMRRAAEMADKAMRAALDTVRPGITELDVAAEAEYVMRKEGSIRPAFGTFVASGERTLLAHPHASARAIQAGEAVVIDLGATYEGYASDVCRTTFTGEPTHEQAAYLHTVIEAQEAAAESLRDGALAGEAYDAAYRVFQLQGLGRFLPHDVGYGVGLRQSEFYPVLEKGSKTVLQKNMVVALLQTTAYSRQIGGLRVEDTFLITEGGSERLTLVPQEG